LQARLDIHAGKSVIAGIQFLAESPVDLTQSYKSLDTHQLESDIYSTDKKPNTWMGGVPESGGYDILRRGDFYSGKGAEYIKESLQEKAREKAVKLKADLVIINFTRKGPFYYRINRVTGLAVANWQGTINARFYKRK